MLMPVTRSALRAATLCGVALAAASLSPRAEAQQLMVGGPDTFIRRTLPVADSFDVVGACGGVVESMAAVGDVTYIGDRSGLIYVHEPGVGVSYAFSAGNDAEALESDGTRLFVGGSDGSVEVYNLATETLVDTWQGPLGLRAMTMVSNLLLAAGDGGVILQTLAQGNGSFQPVVTLGTPVTAMIWTGSELFVGYGAGVGVLARVDLSAGAVTGTIPTTAGVTALGFNLDQLLVASSSGTVERVDPRDGAVLDVLTAGSDIRALALTDGAPPAFTYCYGFQCPCGNDDDLAGCENSMGRGARLTAAGTTSASTDDLALFVTGAPPQSTAIAFVAEGSASGALGDGKLCIGGPSGLQRFMPQQTSIHGAMVIDGIRQRAEARFRPAFQIVSGARLHFQVWYRDVGGACGSGSNVTNSAQVLFTP